MIKKIKITLLVLLALSNKIFACQCIGKTLIDEISDSSNIFIGTVIGLEQNTYKIEINALYKGSLDLNKIYEVIQPNDSCHMAKYDTNETYIFFESNDGFHQCGRTKNIYKSKAIKKLEKIYPNRILNQKNKIKTAEMIYDNLYTLRLFDGKKIDTKNNKILYFDGRTIIENPKNDFNSNWLGIHYYELFGAINIEEKKYDYIIYYEISHEEFFLNEKKKEKLRKKFLKKKSR